MRELFIGNKMFRTLLIYQFFSSLGGSIFSVFMLLSVHLIYQNPIYTGIAGFLMAAPFIFAFAVGPIVDRGNKVTIMRITTFLEFAVLAMLIFVPFQERFGVVFMFTVIFIYSLAALFEAPSSTALLPQIVQENNIMEANSLIRIVTMVGGLIIASILIATLQDGINYILIYSLSAGFLAFAFLFSLLLKDPGYKSEQVIANSDENDLDRAKNTRLLTRSLATDQTDLNRNCYKEKANSQNYLQDLKAGASFIKRSILLFTTIAFVAKRFIIETAGINMPMFAEYHVGARGYIIFGIMALLGGIVASYLVGAFGKKFKVGQLLFVVFALAGIVRIIFVRVLPMHHIGGLIALVLYAAMGSALGIVFQSLEQTIPPKDMVGRVNTMSTTVIAIFVTIGALVGGFLGSIVPVVDHIFIYQGISYIIIGVFIILMPGIRKLPKMDEMSQLQSPSTHEQHHPET